VLVTHNAAGNLVFTRANTNRRPILDFDATVPNPIPFTKMKLGVNGQGMHSHIHVIKQADEDGGNAGESVVRNPYVPFVYRPRVIVQSSGSDVDTELVANNALADELRNVKLVIETDRWEYDNENGIILPNNVITVLNPEIYIFKKEQWFIEQVDFVGDQGALKTTLTCVLPWVYNGQAPRYLWQGINLH
jgi:prophage tail gpP-like protein